MHLLFGYCCGVGLFGGALLLTQLWMNALNMIIVWNRKSYTTTPVIARSMQAPRTMAIITTTLTHHLHECCMYPSNKPTICTGCMSTLSKHSTQPLSMCLKVSIAMDTIQCGLGKRESPSIVLKHCWLIVDTRYYIVQLCQVALNLCHHP